MIRKEFLMIGLLIVGGCAPTAVEKAIITKKETITEDQLEAKAAYKIGAAMQDVTISNVLESSADIDFVAKAKGVAYQCNLNKEYWANSIEHSMAVDCNTMEKDSVDLRVLSVKQILSTKSKGHFWGCVYTKI